MTRALTLLFAIAGGAAVGNLYWAQPLLDFIARDLGASASSAGWLVTATQVGYAAGIVLLVPLGDVMDRRTLIPAILVLAGVALVACALAPSLGVLLVTITLLGVTTVAGQLLTPLAGDLADPAERGRVVGTVASGILTGILLSRTISGLVAGAAGWRTIYFLAAAAALMFAVLLRRAIPPLEPKAHIAYPALIRSVGQAIRRERTLRWTLALGATGFGVFTMFWTSLTFLLSAPPFNYGVTVIGLFGLAGLAGVVAARRAGSLHDAGRSLPATGAAWALALASMVLATFAGRSVVLIVVVIVLLDIAIQGSNLLNQSRVFAISGEARSRLNTAFVAFNFMGGAVGSALASVLYEAGGWKAVTTAGVVLSLFALAVWAIGRRGPLAVGS